MSQSKSWGTLFHIDTKLLYYAYKSVRTDYGICLILILLCLKVANLSPKKKKIFEFGKEF